MTEISFLENKSNLIRLHSLEMTTKAGSGHPTSSLSCAEIMSVLFFKEINYDPQNLDSLDNDEFILSKGHSAPALYSSLIEANILSKQETMKLRKFDSRIEGHPTPKIPFVKVATGSLGQGLSVGLGMSIQMKIDKIDRRVYVLLGDGELQEGSNWEAISLASHLKLNNICAILDMNKLGQSEATMHENNSKIYLEKAKSFGWFAIEVNGHSIKELINAFKKSKNQDKPTFIVAKTIKGKGVSFLENKQNEHGKSVDEKNFQKAKSEIEKKLKEVKWENKNISRSSEILTSQNKNIIKAKMKINNLKELSISTNYKISDEVATRQSYGLALEKLGNEDKEMVVLDGDVKNSTFTENFFKKFPERSIQCFIAEQNMIGVGVGLQSRSKNVFASTFSAFFTRAFDQIRMASYSNANLKLAGSHAGVSIGEDGPSQMGLEDIAMMRTIINSIVLYPCDAVSTETLTNESANYKGISYIRTTRPKTPVIYDNDEEFKIGGSKTLRISDKDKITIVSAGITLHESLKASDELDINVRVIDLYSIKPIDKVTLNKASKETKAIITVEDHYPEGGLGEAVSSVVSGKCPVYKLAVTKHPHSGKCSELLSENRIDKNSIKNKIKEILEN